VPPDAPAIAFTKDGGPEEPGYTVELLVVGRGHPTDSRPLGDPLGPDERGYVIVWVDPLQDGQVPITQLVADAFRARVYLDDPPIWLEHWSAVGGYEEQRVCGALPPSARDAQRACARALRGRVLLHETARIGRPAGTKSGYGADEWRRVAAEVDRLRQRGVPWPVIAAQYPKLGQRTLQAWHREWRREQRP
jgi:hypothetical protein